MKLFKQHTGRQLLLCKLDISQAFDTLSHHAIWRFLYDTDASPEALALWAMCRETRVCLQLGSQMWTQGLERGVLQGTSFSADLFSRILDYFCTGLIERWQQAQHSVFQKFSLPHALLFADDILLFAATEAEMQSKLHALQLTLESIGLRLNLAKCSVLDQEDGTTPGIWGRHSCVPLQGVDHLVYLGVPLSYKATPLGQLGLSLSKLSSAFFGLRRLFDHPDTPVCEKLLLFQTYITSKWTWCCPVIFLSRLRGEYDFEETSREGQGGVVAGASVGGGRAYVKLTALTFQDFVIFVSLPAMAQPTQVQPEPLTGQVRTRAPGPMPPPPPQLPATDQSVFVGSFFDHQILLQVLTVLLTLMVVAVVRLVTSWWQDKTPPEGSSRKVKKDGDRATPVATQQAGPSAEADDDKGQEPAAAPNKPDKGIVKDDGAPPKAAVTVDATTTPTAAPNTGSDDKKSAGAATTTTVDSKTKAAPDGPGTPAVTPHSMLQEIQAVHKLVKTLTDGGAPPDMKKVNGEMENLRKDVTTIMKFLSSSDKDLKDLSGRLSALETVLQAVNARVCTLSSNLDIHAKSTESYLKEALKSISVVGGAAKTFHADTQVLIGAKHDNLEQGIKSCINKVTNCDYESHTSLAKTLSDLSKQTYDMGQELLAALHFVQGEQGTTKDNLWQIANVLSDTVEQVKIIRDYCERPVPVNVQSTGPSTPMHPPPTYEPSIHGARQQLHLQTAIPVARGAPASSTPQVNIDMGDGTFLYTDAPEERVNPALWQFATMFMLEGRDATFMERLRALAREALTWPFLKDQQRLMWAAVLEFDVVPTQVLVTVPSRVLLEQFAEEFPTYCKVGMGYNKNIDHDSKGFVAITDSVHRLQKIRFSSIFMDEAHHNIPPGMPEGRELYKFSATHEQDTDFQYSMGQAIEDGVLCDYDLTVPVTTKGHPYLCLAQLLLAHTGRFRRVLAYCNSVREAQTFQEVLEALGLAAWHMNGATPLKTRQKIMAAFAGPLRKPVHVLVTVQVLGEGVNIPNADTCMFVEPRNSYRSIVQAIGGVLRHSSAKPLAHIVLPAVAAVANTTPRQSPFVATRKGPVQLDDVSEAGDSSMFQPETVLEASCLESPRAGSSHRAFSRARKPSPELACHPLCQSQKIRGVSRSEHDDEHWDGRSAGRGCGTFRSRDSQSRSCADSKRLPRQEARHIVQDQSHRPTVSGKAQSEPLPEKHASTQFGAGLVLAASPAIGQTQANELRPNGKTHARMPWQSVGVKKSSGREARLLVPDECYDDNTQLERFMAVIGHADSRLLQQPLESRVWFADARTAKTATTLSRIAKVIFDKLMFALSQSDRWELRLQALETFAASYGRLPLEKGQTRQEMLLGQWLRNAGVRIRRQSLTSCRVHRLLNSTSRQLRDRVQEWLGQDSGFMERCKSLQDFVCMHQRLSNITQFTKADDSTEYRLAYFLSSIKKGALHLTPSRLAQVRDTHPLVARLLDNWTGSGVKMKIWQTRWTQLMRFLTEAGRLPTSNRPQEKPLYWWLITQKYKFLLLPQALQAQLLNNDVVAAYVASL
ncbi:pol [Symbiodinium sp. KB8]|nr:pol [Symbiodinium sp. KB8]